MGSTAILECWLHPLMQMGCMARGLVARGPNAGVPTHQGNLRRNQWAEGPVFTGANSQEERWRFRPGSFVSGSLDPGKEVSDSHEWGHLAAPLHPPVFAQGDVGPSVDV